MALAARAGVSDLLFLIVFVAGMWVVGVIGYASHLRFVAMTLAGHREVAVKSESPLVKPLELEKYRAVITPLGVDRATRADRRFKHRGRGSQRLTQC